MPIKSGTLVSPCFDHLSGPVGERLTRRLLELGWVTADPTPGVTPAGWKGFADLGINLTPLVTGRRKPVAFCTERSGENAHEHLGGFLGALVRQHFLRNGWLQAAGGKFELTPAGEQILHRLGVNLEENG